MTTSYRSLSTGASVASAPCDAVTAAWTKTKLDQLAVEQGCYFDLAAAERVREFCSMFLCHSKGQWAGQPFNLLDWQWQDVVAPLFGWKREDGSRRYRQAYIEVPKKNGKSTLMSALALYMLIGDGESGAEVYTAAGDRKQASIIYNESAEMVRSSPMLSSRIMLTPSQKHMYFPEMTSTLDALSADAYTKEGLNAHAVFFDELHTQPNRVLWDTLRFAGAARTQPLLIAITTAGWDRESICYEQHKRARQILEGGSQDITLLAVMHSAPDDAKWDDPEVWRKSNPSYGVTVSEDSFQQGALEAKESPAAENAFRRYRLNQWTEQDERWISMEKWNACEFPFDKSTLAGRDCIIGLDLSATTDITAVAPVFCVDGKYIPVPTFFLPGESAIKRERKDQVPYSQWIREGFIEKTSGDVVDYGAVREKIRQLATIYKVREIAFDPWNATQLATQLHDDGFEVVEFRQGFASMSGPTKEMEKIILGGQLNHLGNPVLRWMASNVCVERDAAGNVKCSKAKSTERIDGIVAMVMAIGRYMVRPAEAGRAYEERGILTI